MVRIRSIRLRGRSAPISPTTIAIASHSTAAPATSEAVTPAAGKTIDGHALPALERVPEVAVREPPDELRVLRVPRPVGAHDVRDLADARGRRALARDPLCRVGARQLGDQEEEDERDEGDDQELNGGGARAGGSRSPS